MEENYEIRRKEYVKSIRESFDAPESSRMDEPVQAEAPATYFIFLKVRILISLVLFLGFLLLYYEKCDVLGYDADEIRETISESVFFTSVHI